MSRSRELTFRRPGALSLPAVAVSTTCALVAAAASIGRGGDPITLPVAVGCFALTLAGLLRPLEPAPGTKVTLAGAVGTFAASTIPGAQAVVAVLLASLVAKIVQRASPANLSVNVTKAAAATGAASLVVGALGASVPSLAVAGIAYVAVTLAAVAAMVLTAQGASAARIFLSREWLPTSALASIGVVATLLWSLAPLAIILLVPPLAIIELAARANARSTRTARELAVALDAQRAFAADAAHELRTPLTALRGNLAYIEGAALGTDERGALADARRDLERLLALIERLLLFARVPGEGQAGEVADLAECARETVRTVTPRPGVAVSSDVPAGIGVAMPTELLRTVVGDLVANAVAYTPAGEIAVEARVHGTRAILTVRDTGIGMEGDERLRAFDRFFRGARARQLASGSGLGLAIVRRIVDAYGGSVSLASETGVGTTVTLELPVRR